MARRHDFGQSKEMVMIGALCGRPLWVELAGDEDTRDGQYATVRAMLFRVMGYPSYMETTYYRDKFIHE